MSDFDYLIGGTITKVEQKPDTLVGFGTMTSIHVKLKRPTQIEGLGLASAVEMEVWTDEEGNGPGALVLSSGMVAVPS